MNCRNVILLQPITESLDSSPMAVFHRKFTDDEGSHVNFVRFKPLVDAKLVIVIVGDAIIADEGVSQYQKLSLVAGVGE